MVTMLPSPINTEKQPGLESTVKVVQSTPTQEGGAEVRAETDSDRTTQLLDQLHWDSPLLTSEQGDKIKDLFIQNKDIFALNPLELGVTNIAMHTIDTG